MQIKSNLQEVLTLNFPAVEAPVKEAGHKRSVPCASHASQGKHSAMRAFGGTVFLAKFLAGHAYTHNVSKRKGAFGGSEASLTPYLVGLFFAMLTSNGENDVFQVTRHHAWVCLPLKETIKGFLDQCSARHPLSFLQ